MGLKERGSKNITALEARISRAFSKKDDKTKTQLDSDRRKVSWRRKEEIETGTRYSRRHRYQVSIHQIARLIRSAPVPLIKGAGGGRK